MSNEPSFGVLRRSSSSPSIHRRTARGAATVQPALLWCQRCETLRREHITAQMAEVSKLFEGKP